MCWKACLKVVLALLILFQLTSGISEKASAKEMAIGDYTYVISVPEKWKQERADDVESMKLHLVVQPIRNVIGHFTCHVLDRNGGSLNSWFDYHLETNIPNVYGDCSVEKVEEHSVGAYKIKMVHVYGMENRKGYGLLDALFCTESHILILSYLYDLEIEELACEQMHDILASFKDSRSKTDEARLGCKLIRALGFEEAGLFLNLPEGWVPKIERWGATVRLSSGSFRVFAARSVPSGITGLKRLLKKHVPDLNIEEKMEKVQFGVPGMDACRIKIASPHGDSETECILGLNGRAGYALLIASSQKRDREIFRKIVGDAVVVDPAKVKAFRHDALEAFQKAVKKEDIDEVRRSLSILSLFTEDRTIVSKLAWGIKQGNEEIQASCAVAMGRMGTRRAVSVLESALLNAGTSDGCKIACIESLGSIGGKQAKKALGKMARRNTASCSDVHQVLLETLRKKFD